MSYFSSQTSTLILPTVLFYFEIFLGGGMGAQNAPEKSKNDQILSPTFEIVPIFVLYINFAVVPTF